MKLSRKLLIPIVLISFCTLSILGILSYKYMEREIYDIYKVRAEVTVQDLHEELALTSRISDLVMSKFNEKSLAISRAFAEILRGRPPSSFTLEEMERLSEVLGVDEVHVIDKDGILFAGNVEEYYNLNFDFSDQTRPFLRLLEEPDLEIAQEPMANGYGRWRQYTGVARKDSEGAVEGFVQVGLHYNVIAELNAILNITNRTLVTTIGQQGFSAIVKDGRYIAHKKLSRLDQDVTDQAWYQQIAKSPSGYEWLEFDGEKFLTAYLTKGDTTTLALIPESEYYNRLDNIRNICILLTLLSTLVLACTMFLSVKQDVLNPISDIAGIMRHVARGNLAVSLTKEYSGEFAELKNAINSTIGQLKIREDRVINNYPGIIFSVEKDYTCTLFAGQSMDIFGVSPEMFLDKNMVEVNRTHPEADPEVAQLIEDTFEQEQPQRMHIEKNGRYLTFSTELLHDAEGTTIGMVATVVDITDIREAQTKLEDAIEQAEQASRAKSEFLSRMSHEIRTPMNAIIGMNIIAQKTDDTSKIHYCLKKIRSASDQLLNLINNILDMSKIEANKFELYEDEFDFERMLQNVYNILDVKAAEKKQHLKLDFQEVFTRNVYGDELRLSQVMLNLLTNAVKFTPENGNITLRIRYREIDESIGSFTFDIIDDGIGIAAEHQKHLFASFEQGDGSITRRYGGTGLGLSICKNIVTLMGGDITLESTPDKGSKFSFSVNLKWGNEKDIEDVVHTLPRRNIRILVIDDSEDVREYFSSILELHSLSCDAAESGMEGVEKTKAALSQGNPYDLIFVDWIMPGMNGIETVREIKKHVHKDTIVIMISVAEWADIEKEASAVGIDKFLAKPVLPSVLFTSIVEWLNASELPEKINEETIDWSGKKLLLVEDIDINREIVISMLEDTGIDIECAEDGLQAINMYSDEPDKYDAILMDLQMPELDGLEATRKIRASGLSSASVIPIIAMTANAFKSDVDDCLAAGMNDHIAKPINLDILLNKLDHVLDKEN